jgi:hypothetical protein
MIKQFLTGAIAVTVVLGLGVAPTHATEHETCGVDVENATPAGKVTGSVKTIGWLVGARWGNGVLTLDNGEQRKFHIVGAKALETGVAENEFEGDVFNLNSVEDFEGTFYGAGTGITVGSLGKGEAVVNNARCVVVKLRMTGTGLKFSGPAPGAVEVSFTD